MGKKSKNKKQRGVQRTQTTPVSMPVQLEQAPGVTPPAARAGLELGEQFARRDILRILMLIGVMALVLVAIVIADQQSSFVLEAGRKLASAFRLS